MNLHIQCNSYQSNTSVLHRTRTNNPKNCMEPEKTLNSQSNLEKENQSRSHHNPRLQPIPQSCIIKTVLVTGAGTRTDTQINGTE